MPNETFIIQVVLRARDEMGRVINNATKEMSALQRINQNVDQTMNKLNKSFAGVRKELNQLADQAEKTRRGIRSIGGEDIKIKMGLDDRDFHEKMRRQDETIKTHLRRLEELRIKREDVLSGKRSRADNIITEDMRRHNEAIDEQVAQIDKLIARREALAKGASTRRATLEVERYNAEQARANLADAQAIRTKEELGRTTNTLARNYERAGRAVRSFGRDADKTGGIIDRLDRRVKNHHESVAKFDNEIRGMRVLIIAAQMQALVSAVVALGGALTAVAGSAVAAGSALGGALAAGAAQAIPAIGLLAATVARLKQVFDVVQQVQDAKKAQATAATSDTNKQADSLDALASASDGVRDASQRVAEAQRGVAEAHREARRELIDLMLAERSASLQREQSQDRLRQLRSSGTTGFELRAAEIDVDESRVGARRASQELRSARTGTPEGVRNAVRSLRDAEEGLNRARRGMANARRDAAEGGAATVAAARQLDFMQAQLSGAERRLVNSILRLKETWREVSGPITDTIVESFTRGVDRVEKVIRRPRLINAFQTLANSASGQMDRVTKQFTSDRSVAFFERTTRRLAENLKPATTAGLRLSRAFMNIADAAAPTLNRLFDRFARFAGKVEDVTRDRFGMRELFEFGEKSLQGWLDLAGSIGRTLKAIFAPGGDLARGAGASGIRTLKLFTTEFRNAAEWINNHPLRVDQFFKDSEESLKIFLELLKDIGEVMFELFDPASLRAFADIFEALLPAIQQVAETFGFFSKTFASLLDNPLIRVAFQTGFGFLIFQRIASKFGGLFYSMLGSFTGLATQARNWWSTLVRADTAIQAGTRSTGGLVGRINAATAAWTRYGTAARAAQGQAAAAGRTAAATGATGLIFTPTGGTGPRPGYIDPERGPQAPGSRGPQAPISQGVRGTLATGVATGIAAGGRFARAAGRFALPIAGFLALMDAATASGGVGNRLNAAVQGGTFNQASLRGGVQRGFSPFQFGAREEGDGLSKTIKKQGDAIKEAFTAGNIRRVEELQKRMREWAQGWGGPDGDRAQRGFTKLADGAKRALEVMRPLARAGILEQVRKNFADIVDDDAVKSFAKNVARISRQGFTSMADLRKNMEFNIEQINKGWAQGSEAWQVAVTRNFQQGVNGIRGLMKRGVISSEEGMKEIVRVTRQQARFMRDNLTTLSDEARDNLARSFHSARRAAEREFGGIADATGKGLRIVRRLMRQELTAYGLSEESIKFRLQGKEQSGKTIDAPLVGKAGGGYVGQPGERSPDRGLYALGRGEAVLNWAHQKVVDPAMRAFYGFGLPDMFKRVRGSHAGGGQGFARGGIVPVPGFPGEMANRSILDEIAYYTKRYGLRLSDAYGQGHQSPGHTVFGTAADLTGSDRSMNAAVRELVRRGYKVLYDGSFGSTAWPGHGPSTVAGSNAHIHVEFGGKDANMPSEIRAKLPRLSVSGAENSLGRRILERGLNVVRATAQRRINTAIAAGGPEGSEFGVGPGEGAATRAQMVRWARQALRSTGQSASMGNIEKLLTLARKESGWIVDSINNWDSNAKAGNPSGGLMHVTIDKVGGSKRRLFDPVANMIASINYQLGRYGRLITFSPYAKGGIIDGQEGEPRPILAHAGEWVLNKGQQLRAAAMAGLSQSGLKSALGFSGGPSSFKDGGEVEKPDRSFDLPGLLPTSSGGTRAIIGRLLRFIRKMGNVNSNLDILTRQDGLLDQLSSQLEETTQRMSNAIIRGTYRVKNNRVVRSHSDIWVSQETLDALVTTGQELRRTDRIIGRGLRLINSRIAALREGGLTDREEGIVDDLRVQRRNLAGRRRTTRDSLGENRQSRFEEQERLRELRLTRFTDNIGKSDAGFERGRAWIDFQERMLAATGIIGIGRRSTIFEQRGANIQSQLGALTGFRDIAAARGFTDVVNDLNQRILDLTVEMAENTRALFQARVEEVNRRQQIVASATGARGRIAELQGQLGIITPDEARKRMREQVALAGESLVAQGTGLLQLLNEAKGRGDEEAIIDLEQAVLDNTVAQLENSVQLKELDGTLTGTQSFSSTAWQWFRTAIFTGSGGLLPQFQMPGGSSPGINGPQVSPLPSGPAGGGGGGNANPVYIDITQNEQVDPVWLGNKVAWDINTPTT